MKTFKPCSRLECRENAISFSAECWQHSDQVKYLLSLKEQVLQASASSDCLALNLKKVECEGIDFSQADLRGSSFSQANFTSCLFIGSNLSDVDMTGAKFFSCDFVASDLQRANMTRVSIAHCSFSYSDMRQAYLVEAQFKETDMMGAILNQAMLWNADLSGIKHVRKKNFQSPAKKISEDSAAIGETNYLVAFESYRTLKRYFYEKGLHEDGGWASYRELTMERKYYFQTRNLKYIPSLLMDLISGYTEKPGRVIASSLAVVLFFGFLYYIFDVPRAGFYPGEHITIWDSIYFSFITFTTVGYGDFAPKPIIFFRALACIEAFSGPFMAGLYIFTLTRRYSTS